MTSSKLSGRHLRYNAVYDIASTSLPIIHNTPRLHYKIFWDGFRFIYFQLLEALQIQTNDIKLYVYLYFHISYAIIVLIIAMLYIYMRNFEKLIVKILNYVNMIIVNKDDKFNFFKEFSKKIENLNIILEIYNENPITFS